MIALRLFIGGLVLLVGGQALEHYFGDTGSVRRAGIIVALWLVYIVIVDPVRAGAEKWRELELFREGRRNVFVIKDTSNRKRGQK